MTHKLGTLSLKNVAGRELLAGRPAGEADAPRIAHAARAAAIDQCLVVDLAGVAFVSASYFDAALWPLWSARAELFPVLAGTTAEFIDEIKLVLRDHGAAIWHRPKEQSEPELLGHLDDTLKKTLEQALEHPGVTAPDLAELDRSVASTAMSNRLAALFEMRLLRRRKEGRRLVYAAPWKD